MTVHERIVESMLRNVPEDQPEDIAALRAILEGGDGRCRVYLDLRFRGDNYSPSKIWTKMREEVDASLNSI